MRMFNKVYARGLLALGFLLLGYSIASMQAITGNVTFNYGDPNLRVQWIMLCISAVIIVVAFILLLFKKKHCADGINKHYDVEHIH